ncbi:MAG: saccharopine dehydrogenase C-terminal domain-containing protein [Phycisphaerales bacterium]|nr:saccharopine dehydrogenase C-terminal domain-containing protein [Phycisphaerales bacterium]|tara:strand:- start:3892 stop:5037 length:1146 start_codon:yes stop_codon:yes gene_type:complete
MQSMIILGAGMVGGVMAEDLVADEGREVAIIDFSAERLARVESRTSGAVRTIQADCGDTSLITSIVKDYDMVLGALPSRFGFAMLEAIIDLGKHYCDISFMPEDAWELDEKAAAAGVIALVDCGVAPGMSNLQAGLAARFLDPCHSIDIMVGGIPRDPKPPWNYKAGFSPFDVVEEYLRPSRIIEDGKMVIKEALSEPELLEFEGVGTLEAFNTDGLRSLAETIKVPTMRERTMRYPGHRDLALAMRETGLFDETPIEVNGAMVAPRDVTCRQLFKTWSYDQGEADLTVMRVIGEGEIDGAATRLTWDLLDFYDPQKDQTSMSRTTAFPCTLCARMVEQGLIDEPGVYSMERLAHRDDVVGNLLEGMQARGVTYRETRESI